MMMMTMMMMMMMVMMLKELSLWHKKINKSKTTSYCVYLSRDNTLTNMAFCRLNCLMLCLTPLDWI